LENLIISDIMKKMNRIKSLSDSKEPKISEVGGKGYFLAILTNNGFNVPKGFVITSEAFFEFLEANDLMKKVEKLSVEINEDNFREKSEKVRNLILSAEIPKSIALEAKDALSKLNVQYVSIRSSAASEDSLKASFAGLFDTFLNIKSEPDLVLENVKKCGASLFNERAVIYRIKKEIPHLEGMAVVVQEMIPAEVSGITFTTHPLKAETLLIEASYGIGDMIVSGKVEPDDYTVNRETLEIVEKKIGRKDKMSVGENGSTRIIEVEKGLTDKQVLSDDKIKEIAKTCLKIEKFFKYPQDIEWCISNNKLWLLQSRIITSATR
jgi:pyruvate,water dikinase